MEITNILDSRTIQTNMIVSTKQEALEQLSTLLLYAGYISDIENFMKDVYIREAQGQTGIGDYLAIPHGRSASVCKAGVAIGVLDKEIAWETMDGKGVKAIILFCVGIGNTEAKKHLQLLSMVARKVGDEQVVSKLTQATSSDEVIAALTNRKEV